MWSTLAGLLESRKVQVGISSWLLGTVMWLAGSLGLDIPPQIIGPVCGAIVLIGVLIIQAIAKEDAAAKSAGMAPIKPVINNTAGTIAIAPTGTTETNINAGTASVDARSTTIPPPLGEPSINVDGRSSR